MASDEVEIRSFRRPKNRGFSMDREGTLLEDDMSLFDEVKQLEMQFSSILEDLEDVKRISRERRPQ